MATQAIGNRESDFLVITGVTPATPFTFNNLIHGDGIFPSSRLKKRHIKGLVFVTVRTCQPDGMSPVRENNVGSEANSRNHDLHLMDHLIVRIIAHFRDRGDFTFFKSLDPVDPVTKASLVIPFKPSVGGRI